MFQTLKIRIYELSSKPQKIKRSLKENEFIRLNLIQKEKSKDIK
jgi:hypothetical protein